MPPALRFDNAFWSQKQPQASVPDFQTGLQVLHTKLNQSKVENDEMIAFFKERIAIEESFAFRLSEQSRTPLKSSGFARDDGAVLRGCFENLKATSGRFGEQHKRTADTLTDTVLKPLQKFQEDYKRTLTTSKQSVDASLKQFDGLVKEMDRAKSNYQKKHRAWMMEEEQKEEATSPTSATASTASPPSQQQQKSPLEENQDKMMDQDTTILIGNQRMSRAELDKMIISMKNEIPVGEHRVPILGRYQNTSSGESISIWLQHNMPQCKDSPAMADVVAQQLIQPLEILRLVGQRGNKFSPSPQSFYQWREDTPAASSSYGFNFLERIGGGPQVPIEDQLKRAQRETELADEAYRVAVKRMDQMRMVVEQSLFAHFAEMEQVELKRLAVLKQAIASFSLCLSEMIPGDKALVDDMLVYQESLKPDHDIQYIVQQYCVSSFSPQPILYENQFHGVAQDQIFGVSLEGLARQSEDDIPRFVTLVLDAIDKGTEKLDQEEKLQLWSTKLPLDRIYAACSNLNVPSDQLTPDLLHPYDPMTLVAVLRLYLLELPECLMTFEFYDAAQALYSNHEQDDSIRLQPLSNLIATLPGCHFSTLKLLISHIRGFVQDNKLDDAAVESIGDSFGTVVLRPRHESLTTLTSRVPMYFGRDLIKHYDTFFNEATMKSHAESEKRRQARPLRAESNLADATIKHQQPQQRRSLMTFMRSNNEEKWNMIFQRNATGTTSTTSSSAASVASSERISSSSFTRPTPMTSGTATMQDSPPLSPVKAPAPPPPSSSSEEPSNSAPKEKPVENKEDDKKESNHDEKAQEHKKKDDDDKSEQVEPPAAPAKDAVVFDVVQESRKDNEEALDPFFDDED
ncbi:hypothetical protein K492DRAFT_206369 [Lichtheimia hyalospora FSU 10163]|nr:hypothetical protein K492DRAFT_206369 [Lichtheimia hyalospora FSU 10163]